MDLSPAPETPVPSIPPVPQVPAGKKRHGCLTTWLILMIIGNVYAIFLNLTSMNTIISYYGTSSFMVLFLCALGVLNIVCGVALFKWKKWGFYGFIVSSALVFIINLAIGLNLYQSIAGLIGIAVLYGVLQIGNQTNKGWPQLE